MPGPSVRNMPRRRCSRSRPSCTKSRGKSYGCRSASEKTSPVLELVVQQMAPLAERPDVGGAGGRPCAGYWKTWAATSMTFVVRTSSTKAGEQTLRPHLKDKLLFTTLFEPEL